MYLEDEFKVQLEMTDLNRFQWGRTGAKDDSYKRKYYGGASDDTKVIIAALPRYSFIHPRFTLPHFGCFLILAPLMVSASRQSEYYDTFEDGVAAFEELFFKHTGFYLFMCNKSRKLKKIRALGPSSFAFLSFPFLSFSFLSFPFLFTGNKFSERDNFVKKPGKYMLVELATSREDTSALSLYIILN